jgi:hypothetical protein
MVPTSKKENTLTYQEDFTLPTELLEEGAAQGLDILPELIRRTINTAMQAARESGCVAQAHEARGGGRYPTRLQR